MEKDILIRCKTCNLLFEGLDIKSLCPRCKTPFLEIAARWPHIEEEGVNEKIVPNS